MVFTKEVIVDTYRALADCTNCKRESQHNVPKGTTIADFLREVKCPHCGCETVIKSISQPS